MAKHGATIRPSLATRQSMNNILVINLVLNTFIAMVGVRMLIAPHIQANSLHTIAVPILLFQSMRHLGLMFLAPGVTLPGMPPLFAYTAALGDCLSAALAMWALYLLHRRATSAVAWLWIFNMVGMLDFLIAIGLSRYTNAIPYLGGAYWIPGFFVPLLIAAHYALHVQLRSLRSADNW